MKLLVITNLFPPDWLGGYELACSRLCDRLRASGHELRIITSFTERAPQIEKHPGIRRILFLADRWRSKRPAATSADLTRAWGGLVAENVVLLDREVRAFKPDAILAFNTLGLGGTAITEYLELSGLPWIWSLGDDVPVVQRDVLDFGRRMLFKNGDGQYRNCKPVYVSNHLRDLVSMCGIRFEKSPEVLPRGLSGQRLPDFEKNHHDQIGFLMVGSLSEYKGIDIIINAVQLLRDKGIALTVDVFGDGDLERYEALCAASGIDHIIKFSGAIPPDDALSVYLNYDVALCPSHARDACAQSPFHAAACGTPSILSDTTGSAEYFVDGVHCIKALRTPEGFADAMVFAVEHRDELKNVGRRARSMAREFSEEKITSKYEEIISREMARSAARRIWSAAEVASLYYAKQRLFDEER